MAQARRHGRHSGAVPPQRTACAPPNENCAPPKRGLCPEEINRLGAIGVQFEVKILIITLEFVGKNYFFVDFAINTNCLCGYTPGFMKIRVYFGRKTFFLVFTSEVVEIRTFFGMKTMNLWKFAYCLGRRPFFFNLHLGIRGNSH